MVCKVNEHFTLNASRVFTQCKSECFKMKEVVSALGMSKRTLRIICLQKYCKHVVCHRMSENGVSDVWSHLLLFNQFVNNLIWNPFYLVGQMISQLSFWSWFELVCANLQNLPVKLCLLWKWLFCLLCSIHNYTVENRQWTLLSVKFQ